jgi:hypothetical protein
VRENFFCQGFPPHRGGTGAGHVGIASHSIIPFHPHCICVAYTLAAGSVGFCEIGLCPCVARGELHKVHAPIRKKSQGITEGHHRIESQNFRQLNKWSKTPITQLLSKSSHSGPIWIKSTTSELDHKTSYHTAKRFTNQTLSLPPIELVIPPYIFSKLHSTHRNSGMGSK